MPNSRNRRKTEEIFKIVRLTAHIDKLLVDTLEGVASIPFNSELILQSDLGNWKIYPYVNVEI